MPLKGTPRTPFHLAEALSGADRGGNMPRTMDVLQGGALGVQRRSFLGTARGRISDSYRICLSEIMSGRHFSLGYSGLRLATEPPQTRIYLLRIGGVITIYPSSSFGRKTWPRRE